MESIEEVFQSALRLHRSGNLEEAEDLYRQVLQTNADHAGCHFNLGIVLRKLGRLDDAISCYRHVLRLEPHNARAYCTLGSVLREQGRLEEAAQCLRQAIAADPHLADAHNNLGIILKTQDKSAEAALCYRQALAINPLYVDAHNNLGVALMALRQPAAAIASFRRALAGNPGLAVTHLNLGNALRQEGRQAEAITCYQQALRIDPLLVDAHNNLGNAFDDLGDFPRAIDCYRRALGLSPDHADLHINLSSVLRKQGVAQDDATRLQLYQEARAHNEEALRLHPGHGSALCQRALLRLQEGDYEGGWQDFEQRWTQPGRVPRHLDRPRWDGSALAGKTVLVYAEQGLGDTIQFVRYLPMVKERVGAVLFECQPALARLLVGMEGIDQLFAQAAPLPSFDVQIPLLSLPGIFGTTLKSIPAKVPYLRADPGRVKFWQKELAPLGSFKVGIAWQGNPDNAADRARSLPLARFEGLARLEGVRLISLQKGPGADQIAALAGRFDVLDLSDRLDNHGAFTDTAAVLANLDLVVTVESAVAHLAGALGVPVWTLLTLVPDWRWLLERTDSPWYPTMRLFRQSRYGDWERVMRYVLEEIRNFLW